MNQVTQKMLAEAQAIKDNTSKDWKWLVSQTDSKRGESATLKKDRKGNLIVITGPSGVGKGTVVSKLLKRVPQLRKSVSVTTRPMRATEAEGVDYFFRTAEQFKELKDKQEFMEWAEFAGSCYATPCQWVIDQTNEGIDVILEIEVQGAKQIKRKYSQAVLVFVSPPSFEALRERLRGRATEDEEKVTLRLNKAKQELTEKHLFQYEVVNDDIEEAVNSLQHIVYAERCRI
jgi:guanylate kinase